MGTPIKRVLINLSVNVREPSPRCGVPSAPCPSGGEVHEVEHDAVLGDPADLHHPERRRASFAGTPSSSPRRVVAINGPPETVERAPSPRRAWWFPPRRSGRAWRNGARGPRTNSSQRKPEPIPAGPHRSMSGARHPVGPARSGLLTVAGSWSWRSPASPRPPVSSGHAPSCVAGGVEIGLAPSERPGGPERRVRQIEDGARLGHAAPSTLKNPPARGVAGRPGGGAPQSAAAWVPTERQGPAHPQPPAARSSRRSGGGRAGAARRRPTMPLRTPSGPRGARDAPVAILGRLGHYRAGIGERRMQPMRHRAPAVPFVVPIAPSPNGNRLARARPGV